MINWEDWPSKTDKGYAHNILPIYDRLLRTRNPKTILEVGILNGDSVRMWASLFPDSLVVAVDVQDCSSIEREFDNVRIYHADAYTDEFLSELKRYSFDFIIDDGSHILKHQCFFAEKYPLLLEAGGLMVVEDIASIDHAHVIQHFVPDSFLNDSYIVDRRGAPCPYPYERFEDRNEIMVVVDR